MGRTLQNTMINLGLQNACDEAIYQVRPWAHGGLTFTAAHTEAVHEHDRMFTYTEFTPSAERLPQRFLLDKNRNYEK